MLEKRNHSIPKLWIHIETDHIESDQFLPIENIPLFPKPNGGLWASPLELNSPYRSKWHQFSLEIWGKITNDKAVVFKMKKNARIYVINSQEDLIRLIEEVGEYKDPLIPEGLLRGHYIDFEKAKEVYDVIYLTHEGQARTRTPWQNRGYNLYGWDFESCLIMNPYVITHQMPVSLSLRKRADT